MGRLQALKHAHLRESPLEVTVPQLTDAGGWLAEYGRDVPMVLEIGLGKDPHIIERAAQNPDSLHIGLEYSRKKLDMILAKATRQGVENLRVVLANAMKILCPLFPERSLQQIYVLFPDPWPKKRHQKKRIVQPEFVRHLSERLADGCELELRTDDDAYVEWMVATLEAEPNLENLLGPGHIALEPRNLDDHIPTLFEKKFVDRGRRIHYLYYTKRSE